VKLPAGTQLPANSSQLSAALLLPAGARGPAFLVLDNFRAILKYNNSSSYALAVSLLGDRFYGWGFIAGSWPKDDLPLSRSERIELQNLLNASGHEAGNPMASSAPTPARPFAMRSRRRAGRRMAIRRTNCWRACAAESVDAHRGQARSHTAASGRPMDALNRLRQPRY
jgi:hypothetical protein